MMTNAAQVHLLLNHLPVIIPLVAILVFAGSFFLRESAGVVRRIGLCLFVLSAITAIPTYLTGEPAEKIVKNYPNVSRALIHDHEKSAKYSFIAIEIIGAMALLLLLAQKAGKAIPGAIWGLLFLLSSLMFAHIAWTAHLGGEIRHEEIRTEEPPPVLK
jgi:hypothetical protein